jgi:serine/threonine protein kinase
MANDNLIGKTVGGYEIIGIIGRGGMATVYKAHQISMNRTVALKVLPHQYVDDDTYMQRFQREVRIVSQLEHRAIVPVYDYGEQDRQPFIVMRYMPAGSVDSLLIDGPVPMERIIEIIQQIAPALDYAHSKNVLHRDLKPSNVLLDDGGGAYLTDFGIARILGEASGNTITTQGVVGTPAYMSPEQAQGKPLDGRSDVYALGVMVFEMATGRRPFESDTPYGVAVMQVMTPPPPPRSINPALPPAVENVIYRAMDKNANKRYQTALALSDALEKAWYTPQDPHDTQKRTAGGSPPPAVNHPPPPSQMRPPHNITPPYAPPSPAGPRDSAWIPQVQASRPRRKRGPNMLMSLLIGAGIGCLMLTALMGAAVYFFGTNFDDIFAEQTIPAGTPSVTPGGINIIGSPQPTRTPFDDANVTDVRVIPSNTPAPTSIPPPTTTPGPTNTPTTAPIGVRPGSDGAAVPGG